MRGPMQASVVGDEFVCVLTKGQPILGAVGDEFVYVLTKAARVSGTKEAVAAGDGFVCV